MDEQVADDDQPAGLERRVDRAVQLPLLLLVRDVVERQRGDDGVAARQLLLEPAAAQVDPAAVRGTPRRGGVDMFGSTSTSWTRTSGSPSRIVADSAPVPAPRSTT